LIRVKIPTVASFLNIQDGKKVEAIVL